MTLINGTGGSYVLIERALSLLTNRTLEKINLSAYRYTLLIQRQQIQISCFSQLSRMKSFA